MHYYLLYAARDVQAEAAFVCRGVMNDFKAESLSGSERTREVLVNASWFKTTKTTEQIMSAQNILASLKLFETPQAVLEFRKIMWNEPQLW